MDRTTGERIRFLGAGACARPDPGNVSDPRKQHDSKLDLENDKHRLAIGVPSWHPVRCRASLNDFTEPFSVDMLGGDPSPASMTASGHEDAFPPPRLSGRCRLRKRSLAVGDKAIGHVGFWVRRQCFT